MKKEATISTSIMKKLTRLAAARDAGQLAEYRRQKRRLGAEPPGGAEQEVQSVMEGIVGIDISAFDIGQ